MIFANAHTRALVTGGTSGIRLGMVERFLSAGAKALTTGRDECRLNASEKALPGLRTIRSDIGLIADREALARHVQDYLPGLNVVINNAGIQRRVSLAEDDANWSQRQGEINILLAGPVHLNSKLVPLMLKTARPGLIVNVTSGGAFVPQAFAPVYSACKAAFRSYTVTLRHALRATLVRGVELIPPALATGLAGEGAHGALLDVFCDSVFPKIATGEEDAVAFWRTATREFQAPMQTYREMFDAASSRFAVTGY